MVLFPHLWKHRRVDSVRLESGDRGRRKTSIDCTVPRDDRLMWSKADRAQPQLVVPVDLFTKGPLRDFDITGSNGVPLPVLGMRDSASLALEMLEFTLHVDEVPVSRALRQALEAIVLEPSEPASPNTGTPGPEMRSTASRADVLLTTGLFDGIEILSASLRDRVTEATSSLLHDLEEGYYLFALVPMESAGTRQVLKLSYFWKVRVQRLTLAASLGWAPRTLEIPVSGTADAASYHLEVHLPSELRTYALELPPGSSTTIATYDARPGVVAHAHGAYETRSATDRVANAALLTAGSGTWLVAFATSWATFLFFLLSTCFDGALRVLRQSDDAGTLLLTLPAIVLTIFLGVREHALTSVLLNPLRVIIATCAGLLVLAAAALTWQLRDPWFCWLWTVSLAVSFFFTAAMTIGLVARLVRRKP